MQDKNALTRWDLFPEEKLDLWAEIPVSENLAQTDAQTNTQTNAQTIKGKAGRKRIVLDESGMVVSSANLSVPLSAPVAAVPDVSSKFASSASKSRYLIRFAVCLFEYNAESVKRELGAKGVESAVRLGKRKMPFYRLKIGPFPDSIARNRVLEILREMSVAVAEPSSAEAEDKALITVSVWLKSRVSRVKKKLDAISIGMEVLTGKKTKAVFRVVSPYFDDHSVAVRRLEEWRKKKIDGVLEKIES